jgi:hypothetical protein
MKDDKEGNGVLSFKLAPRRKSRIPEIFIGSIGMVTSAMEASGFAGRPTLFASQASRSETQSFQQERICVAGLLEG